MMFMTTNLLQLPLELWNPPLEQVERLWERQRQPSYTAEKLMRDQAGFAIQSDAIADHLRCLSSTFKLPSKHVQHLSCKFPC